MKICKPFGFILVLSLATLLGSGTSFGASLDVEARLKALEDRARLDHERIQHLEAENKELRRASGIAAAKGATAAATPANEHCKPAKLPTPKVPETAQEGGSATKALQSTEFDKSDGDPEVRLRQLSDGFDVPESPAAAVVGVSQDKTQHLKTPKQLIPAVINGLDEHGHFQSGLSVDFAPMQYFWGNDKLGTFRYHPDDSLGQDLNIWWRRILVRTQVSLAATHGTTDSDKSSKIALGLHSVIANSDDALSSARPVWRLFPDGTCRLVDESDERPLDATGHSMNHWVQGFKEFWSQEARERRFAEHRGQGMLRGDDSWWKPTARFFYSHVSWAVGGAPLWVAPDDKSDYQYTGSTFWSSFAFSPSQEVPFKFVADIIYKNGELLPAADALGGSLPAPPGGVAPKTFKQDSLFLTGGLRFGNRDFNATLTGAYLDLDQGPLGSDQAYRYALAIEKRVSTNSFLTLSISKDSGHDDGKNPTVVLGGMKVGLGGRDFTTGGQERRAAVHGME